MNVEKKKSKCSQGPWRTPWIQEDGFGVRLPAFQPETHPYLQAPTTAEVTYHPGSHCLICRNGTLTANGLTMTSE